MAELVEIAATVINRVDYSEAQREEVLKILRNLVYHGACQRGIRSIAMRAPPALHATSQSPIDRTLSRAACRRISRQPNSTPARAPRISPHRSRTPIAN